MTAAARYTPVAIALHWLMALLIIGNLAGGFLHDLVPSEGGGRSLVMGLHKSFGLLIIGLGLARLGWRLANPPPPLPAHLGRTSQALARAGHLAFYATMLALPLSGWVLVTRSRFPLQFFWLFDVPKFPVGKAVADAAASLHGRLGWAMVALLALHLAAIALHRLRDRLDLLPRMGLGRPVSGA